MLNLSLIFILLFLLTLQTGTLGNWNALSGVNAHQNNYNSQDSSPAQQITSSPLTTGAAHSFESASPDLFAAQDFLASTGSLLPPHSIEELNDISGKYHYYRFTVHVPGNEYVYVATNKTQLLFISAFSEFFTFKLLTREFWFGNLTLDNHNARMLVDEIKGPGNLDKTGEDGWAMNLHQTSEFNKALLLSVLNSTNIGSQGMSLCEEITRDWLTVGLNWGERQLISAKSYYCCTTVKCGYELQKVVLSLVHLIFFLFKFSFALLFLKFIVRKRKFFFMPKEHAVHVTNIYYNPPFWIATFFPKRKWAYDIRNWVFLNIVAVTGAVFALNILHTFVPVDWDESNRGSIIITPGEFFSNVKIGRISWPGLWSYGLIVLPLVFVVVSISMCVKLCSQKTSLKMLRKEKLCKKRDDDSEDENAPVTFKIALAVIFIFTSVLKLIFCAFLSMTMTVLVIFFLLRAYDLFEYNDAFVFLHGFVLWVIGTGYLYSAKTTKLISKISDHIFERIKGKSRNASNSAFLNEPLLDAADDSSSESGSQRPAEEHSNRDFSPISELFFILRFMIAYQAPSLIFESVWFGFTFFAAFLASSLVCRFIWSQLLLFILYPSQIQIGAYILTLLGTVGKFIIDLSNPHSKVRSMLLGSKPLVSLDYAQKWNNYIMTFDQDEIFFKHEVNETPRYFVPLTWEAFFRICDQVKVDYFIYKILGRAVFTIFVISIFFMGFVVFGEGATTEISDILKLAALSLLPLLPKVVQVLEGKNVVEDATHDIRFKSAVIGVEYSNAPSVLSGLQSKPAGKQGLSPTLMIVKPVPPPPPMKKSRTTASRPRSSTAPSNDEELRDIGDSLSPLEVNMIRQEILSKTKPEKRE
uniref:Uncharacterized protein n=1 Tax=Percolomonas cosmopolitus TaxID=63605 RepID=A0A7S1KTM3_9EUKA